MVSDHTHSHIALGACTILDAREGSDRLDHRSEDVGIVVGRLPLQSHTETLEAHTGIDHLIRQRLQATISLAVILHEDEVPDLDDLWMALVYER